MTSTEFMDIEFYITCNYVTALLEYLTALLEHLNLSTASILATVSVQYPNDFSISLQAKYTILYQLFQQIN